MNALESIMTMLEQGFTRKISVKFTSVFLNILGRNPPSFKNGFHALAKEILLCDLMGNGDYLSGFQVLN